MCNPRRVMIHISRSIEQAWQQTVEQNATISEQVNEGASMNAEIRLADEMGDMALAMLERVLAGEFKGFDPWQRDAAGRYFLALDQVRLIYDPAKHTLVVETQLTDTISAEARGAAEASGITVGDVVVDAVGRYYEDGWGGRTKETALAEAQRDAEHRLNEAIEALHREQHAQELETAKTQAQAGAEERAREELAKLREQTRAALRERLQIVLAQAQEQVYHTINRAVGESYRQTLRQLVLQNGGRVLLDEQTGSVINMELELY